MLIVPVGTGPMDRFDGECPPRLRRVERLGRPCRSHRPLRQRRPKLWLAVLLSCAGASLLGGATRPCGAGERPPSRLRLAGLGGPLVPGQQASLLVETVDEQGQKLAATQPLVVALKGAAGLTATTRVTVPAHASEVTVPVRAARPGLWQIEASSEGLFSASTVIACVSPALLQHHQVVTSAARRTPVAAAAPAHTAAPEPPQPSLPTSPVPRSPAHISVLPPPPPPSSAAAPPTLARPAADSRAATAQPAARSAALAALPPFDATARPLAPAGGSATTARRRTAEPLRLTTPNAAAERALSAATHLAAGAALASAQAPGTGTGDAQGGVLLIPGELQIHRGTQGWLTVSLDAYWYQKGVPSAVPRDLDLVLEPDPGDLQIDPARLTIPAGDFVSRSHAAVIPRTAGAASVQARYNGGLSNRVAVSFLSAPPARLSFTRASETISAFGVASSEVYVRLLSDAGEPAVAVQPIQVNVQLTGPTGSPQVPPAVIGTGTIETLVPLELPRFGSYTVLASAANLGDAAPLTIQVAFDWLLLLATLLGGILGSLTLVLYQSQQQAAVPRRVLRVVLLGSLAALLVVLLAAFGLLSLLTGALPQSWAQALARVPLGSLTGVFLLGFLAGLLFDRVFGGLVSPPGGAAGTHPKAPAAG